MSDRDAMRDYARALFAPDEPEHVDHEPPDPKAGNVVPTEGGTPGTPTDADHDMREFTRVLFGHSSVINQITD